jgi:TonB family protein
MIRYALVVMALIATPCWAAEVPGADSRHGVPPPTCPSPDTPPYALLSSNTHDTLAAARRPIAEFQAATDVFTHCLAGALSLQRIDWDRAHQAPDLTVAKAVDNAIAAWERYKHTYVGGFNWQLQQYLTAHPSDGGDPIAYLHLTPPPQFGAPSSGTAAVARLSMPSHSVRPENGCAGFFPDMSRRIGESGRVVVDYDIAAEGTVQNVRIAQSSGFERLDQGATACVQSQTFMPAIVNGVPAVSTGYEMQINFSLH